MHILTQRQAHLRRHIRSKMQYLQNDIRNEREKKINKISATSAEEKEKKETNEFENALNCGSFKFQPKKIKYNFSCCFFLVKSIRSTNYGGGVNETSCTEYVQNSN